MSEKTNYFRGDKIKEISDLKKAVTQLRTKVAKLRATVAGNDRKIKEMTQRKHQQTEKPRAPAYVADPYEDPELAEAIRISMMGSAPVNDFQSEEDQLAMALSQSLHVAEPDPVDSMSYEQLLTMEEEIGSVSKGLTDTQIESLPQLKYSGSSSTFCSICQGGLMRGIRVTTLRCTHLFHTDWINQWLSIKKVCPVCMEEVNV